MYVCLLAQAGEILLHQNMKASPEAFLRAISPSRQDLVVAVECLLTWYWLADLRAREELPCVLGHALSMKASHGGQAKNDTIAAPTRAVPRRGGLRPQAYVYPAEMRATRDRLRRRIHLRRKRAALLTHLQKPNGRYNLPTMGKNIADKAHRLGIAERVTDPAVQRSIAVDLALIDRDDRWRSDLALSIVPPAQPRAAHVFSRLRSIPGVGKLLALVLLYAIHAIHRFPRVQACVSYGRLVTCAKASAGKRDGSMGAKSGQADLTWACSDAAGRFLRNHPAGQKGWARLEKNHGKGKALTVLAHQLARAVDDRRRRETAFHLATSLKQERDGARAPDASLDVHGVSLGMLC